jgi:hypothetical protein
MSFPLSSQTNTVVTVYASVICNWRCGGNDCLASIWTDSTASSSFFASYVVAVRNQDTTDGYVSWSAWWHGSKRSAKIGEQLQEWYLTAPVKARVSKPFSAKKETCAKCQTFSHVFRKGGASIGWILQHFLQQESLSSWWLWGFVSRLSLLSGFDRWGGCFREQSSFLVERIVLHYLLW